MISKQKGFSLLEVLISFVLLIVGVLGLIKLQVFVDKKNQNMQRIVYKRYMRQSLNLNTLELALWTVVLMGPLHLIPS